MHQQELASLGGGLASVFDPAAIGGITGAFNAGTAYTVSNKMPATTYTASQVLSNK
jgi:hypothetical protein